jgi:glycosyltransferase involved in cell wall biosynthesis
MNTPPVRLSVITACYNAAHFLAGWAESVRAAWPGGAVEMIVLDDGSTDDTRRVVEGLGGGITYAYQPNQRQCVGRNTALPLATGDYLIFLDADDRLRPGVVAAAIELMDRRPDVPLAYFDALVGNDATGWKSMQGSLTPTDPPVMALPHATVGDFRVFEYGPYRRALATRNVIFLGAAVVRRDAAVEVGGFDPRTVGAEDWHFSLKVSERGPFAYCPAVATNYLRHGGNFSSDKDRMVGAFCAARRAYLERPGAAEVRDVISAGLRDETTFHADLAYGRGDYPLARRRYRAATRECGLTPRIAYGLAMTSLPRRLVDAARHFRPRR